MKTIKMKELFILDTELLMKWMRGRPLKMCLKILNKIKEFPLTNNVRLRNQEISNDSVSFLIPEI